MTLPSPLAERALASMLPSLNPEGGSQRQIRHAMDVMGNAVHLRQLLYQVAGAHGRDAASRLGELPTPTRLALEMVLHEDDERRTMEGELAALERRWREAEEVARIADALAIRPEVEAKLRDLRRLPA